MVFNKCKRMLLGIAIGDAYGAGYEFIEKNGLVLRDEFDFTKYKSHPNPGHKHKAGMYTDDTQMTIAICELMLSGKEFNSDHLADHFVDCYKRDPIVGYSSKFQDFLDSVKSGEEFLEKMNPNSIRNGAAMRSVPFGMIYDVGEMIKYATINAKLTHDTPSAIASSITVSLLSHLNYNDKESYINIFDYVLPYLKDFTEFNSYIEQVSKLTKSSDISILLNEKDSKLGVPCNAMKTTGAVMFILNNYHNSSDILKESVLLGGDTDSVASIALGIHSINNSLEDLPEFCVRDLTNHKYGKDYLIRLGEKLEKKLSLQGRKSKFSF